MTDQASIDQLCRNFFELFTNADGKTPTLQSIYALCIPQALIIKKEKEGETVYSLDSFLAPRQKMLFDGTLTHFKEWETSENTFTKGNIGYRYCTYAKSGIMNGVLFNQTGYKIFQLIKSNGS